MNEKKKNPAVQIWYVAYPFLFYYAVSIIVMSLCTMIMGDSQAHFVARQLVTTIVTIPFMMPFYKQDRAFAGREEIHDWFTRERLCVIGASVLIVACISISLNNIISMTPLVTASVVVRFLATCYKPIFRNFDTYLRFSELRSGR